MRHYVLLMVLVGVLLSVGCEQPVVSEGQHREFNQALVRTYNDMALTNAIVRQHTLYAYHFAAESASLNALGERDLGVLAAHYAETPGTLYVDEGGASAALYGERVASVKASLAAQGVDVAAMEVGPGMAGGEGMSSTDVLSAKKKSGERRQGQALTVTTGASATK